MEDEDRNIDDVLAEEDESGNIERAVTRLRNRVIRRRKKERKRQRRGVKGPAPKLRKKEPPSDSSEINKPEKKAAGKLNEERPRKWVSIGWLSEAAINGFKKLTLQPWTAVKAAQYEKGDLVDLFDKPPSSGGKKLGIVRITQTPHQILTNELTKSDFSAMGFDYLRAHRIKSPTGQTIGEVEEELENTPSKMWAVHFTIEQLTDPNAPVRGTVRVEG